MTKYYELNKHFYPVIIRMVISDDFEHVGKVFEADTSNAVAITMNRGSEIIIAINPWHPRYEVGILAHESLHVATSIAYRIGEEITSGNDESYAYLIEYLVREMNERIKRLKP